MTLNLYLDITNRRLVRSFDSDTAFTLPSWFQGDDIVLNIFPLIPASDPSQGPFRYAELQGTTLRAALCGGSGRPAGTDGSSTYLAYQDAFTAIEHGFTGNLSLATEELATFIGAQSSASSTFEIEVTDGDGNKTTLLQAPQWINAEVIEVGMLTPAQQPSYFTKTESDARYVQQGSGGGNGRCKIRDLQNPSSPKELVIDQGSITIIDWVD